ncbi:MAG: winged helix-turn-helix transcriptional regulator [Clostridiales bacterium]|nr:winged helix-turn-helix transcriptional regulator [Clostridiales bacterium]
MKALNSYEYSLTERGHSLVRVLDKLCDWGNENRSFT